MSRRFTGFLLATVFLLTGCTMDGLVTTKDLKEDAQNDVYEVSGAVLRPGPFHLPLGESITVKEAIRRCGGVKPGNSWDDGGDLDSVRVQRLVNGSVVEVTLKVYPGGRDESYLIQAGDYITVPKRPFSSPVPNPLPFAS